MWTRRRNWVLIARRPWSLHATCEFRSAVLKMSMLQHANAARSELPEDGMRVTVSSSTWSLLDWCSLQRLLLHKLAKVRFRGEKSVSSHPGFLKKIVPRRLWTHGPMISGKWTFPILDASKRSWSIGLIMIVYKWRVNTICLTSLHTTNQQKSRWFVSHKELKPSRHFQLCRYYSVLAEYIFYACWIYTQFVQNCHVTPLPC
jgi:hypothetical protein